MAIKTQFCIWAFIFSCLILLVFTDLSDDELRKSHILSTIRIDRVAPGRGKYSGVSTLYFTLNTHRGRFEIAESCSTKWLPDGGGIVLGKYLPILYSPSNPKNFRLLITKSDFNDFDLQQPDSLYWANSVFK